MNIQEIITDEEIDLVHGYSNFGDMTKRDVVNLAALKVACGFYQGSTSTQIIREHGLIDPKKYELTPKGRAYLWAAFGDGKF